MTKKRRFLSAHVWADWAHGYAILYNYLGTTIEGRTLCHWFEQRQSKVKLGFTEAQLMALGRRMRPFCIDTEEWRDINGLT